MDRSVCYLIPVDGNILCCGHHIFEFSIYLFQYIGGGTGDQDIGKSGNSICVSFRIQFHCLSTKGSTGKLELNTGSHTVLRGFGYLQGAFLQHIVKGDGRGLTRGDGNRLNILGLIPVDDLLSYGVSAGPQALYQRSAIAIQCYSLGESFTGNGKGQALHNTVFRGLNDLTVSGNQLINGIHNQNTVRSVLIQCYGPFALAGALIIGREYGLNDFVLAVFNVINGSVSCAVSGSDGVLQSGIGSGGCHKVGTCQRIAAVVSLMNLDFAGGLNHIFGDMPETISRRSLTFDLVVFHPVDRHNLRTSVVTHVDTEVNALIGAGVDSDMHITGSTIAKHNDVANSQLAAVHIVLTCADLLNGTGIGQIGKCLPPSGAGLGVPAGCIDSIHNELCVSTFHIDDVAEVVGYEGRTA